MGREARSPAVIERPRWTSFASTPGSPIRVLLAIWFTSNTVAVAVQSVAIAWLSTIDGSCTRGASIVTLPPVVALLRRALTHDSDFDGYVARIGNKRLPPVRIGTADWKSTRLNSSH